MDQSVHAPPHYFFEFNLLNWILHLVLFQNMFVSSNTWLKLSNFGLQPTADHCGYHLGIQAQRLQCTCVSYLRSAFDTLVTGMLLTAHQIAIFKVTPIA